MRKLATIIFVIFFAACSKDKEITTHTLDDGVYRILFYNIRNGINQYPNTWEFVIKQNNQLYTAIFVRRGSYSLIGYPLSYSDTFVVNNENMICNYFKHYELVGNCPQCFAQYDTIITDTSFYHIKSFYWDNDKLLNATYEGYYYADSLKPKVTGNFRFEPISF